jgi:hypothetical protein
MTNKTFIISDAIELLIQSWNRYTIDQDPNILMNGMGVCIGLTGKSEGHFTDEEVEFVNMYIDECGRVFSDSPEDNNGY